METTETALIIALLTTLSAVIAPVVSALITQIGTYKTKRTELFFYAKVEAYKNYLSTASQTPLNPPAKDIGLLQDALSSAMLFSSKDTQYKISLYGSLLLSRPTDTLAISVAHQNMIAAMQADLKKNK